MSVKHSILVISYNQAELLPQCLNSIFTQSLIPYEVVICDDCSTDNTWEVIQDYADRYPDIIKAHRNNPNLGAFGNINKIKKLATGDFINFIAGDDMLPQGVLEKYTNFIDQNNLDCNVPFIILSDCVILNQDGSTKRFSNQKTINSYEIFESAALNCLWMWDTGISKALLEEMLPMETTIGYQADLLWHFDKLVKAHNHYYIPTDGYIYRANVGVTVNTKLQQHFDSKCKTVNMLYERYPERITPKIKTYFDFDKALTLYHLAPTINNYWSLLWRYFRAGCFRPNNIYRGRVSIIIPYSVKYWLKRISGKS